MKIAMDFMPLVLYLAAYVAADIYVATGVLIGAMAVQVIYWKITRGSVGKLPWVNFALAGLFGGLTLAWSDPQYLILRATVLYLVVSAALLLVYWIAGRNLLQAALQSHIDAPDAAWKRALYTYAGFFAFLAGLNVAIGYGASEVVWVAFDSIGVLVIIAAFAVLHFFAMRRRYEAPAEAPASNQ